MSDKQGHNASATVDETDVGTGTDPSSDSLSRRDFLTSTAVVGAAAAVGAFPYIGVRAAESGPIKFGLLEDRSGNFAIFGLNKWHGTQLAIKEINEGWTLDGGVQGPGGSGVFAKVAKNPPTSNIKEVVDRGGEETEEDTAWNESDDYLIKSGEEGVLGRISSSARPIRSPTTLSSRLLPVG